MYENNDRGGQVPGQNEAVVSLVLGIIAVVLWFFGYNAVTSKYAVYASSVLNLDYNATLTIATGAAIVSHGRIRALDNRHHRRGICVHRLHRLRRRYRRAQRLFLLLTRSHLPASV